MSSGGIKNKVVQDGDEELRIVEPCKRRKLQRVTSGVDSDDDDWISTINAGIMEQSKVRSKTRKEPVEEGARPGGLRYDRCGGARAARRVQLNQCEEEWVQPNHCEEDSTIGCNGEEGEH